MSDQDSAGIPARTTRRDLLMGSAIGAGALFTASGLSASARAAAQPGGVSPAVGAGPESYFLKIEGITDRVAPTAKLKGYIQLSDFSFGATHPVNSTGTGAGTGAAKEQAFHFDAQPSLASPLLMLAAAKGASYPTGGGFVTDGPTGAQFIKWAFTNLVISSYQTGGFADGSLFDKCTLLFHKVNFAYYPFNADGVLGTPTRMSWTFR